MPEIVSCPKCGKETYQGRASCPHCGGWLLEHPFSALAPDLPTLPDHQSFLALKRAGAFRLRINFEDLDLERLMPAASVRGFRQTTMRVAQSLDPVVNVLLTILPRTKTELDMVERDLSLHFMRKSRAAAVNRAMEANDAYYESVVRSGTVVVEVL